MASKVPSVKFGDGYSMPMIGLGTYLPEEGDLEGAVKYAIDVGYRHIDTAYLYRSEKGVGNAVRAKIEDGTVTREEMFITTKVWNNYHREHRVVESCKKSLKDLGLDYIDLFLVHWPYAFKDGDEFYPVDAKGNWIFEDTDYLETWRGMEECKRLGLVRSIGVSNFNSEQITRLLGAAKIKPVNNQIEVNINVPNVELIEFCKKHDITVVGYSPLSRPGNFNGGIDTNLSNQKIQQIANKYKKSAAQIACRFVFQLGAAPIPKSLTPSRIKENFEIFDFELTADEMDTIKSIGNGQRTCLFPEAKDDKYFPFAIPF